MDSRVPSGTDLTAGIEDLALYGDSSQLNGEALRVEEDEDFEQTLEGMKGEPAGYTAEHACRWVGLCPTGFGILENDADYTCVSYCGIHNPQSVAKVSTS